jgi:tetratricopeptide (TPR) repeat protein
MSEQENYAFGLVHARFALGLGHLRQGFFTRAIPVLSHGLELARARSVALLDPAICGALGSAYALSGQITEGLRLLQEGVHGAESMGHVGFTIWTRTWLAEGLHLAGERAEAIETAKQCQDIIHRRLARWLEVQRILGDIEATAETQTIEKAERHYKKSLSRAQEMGMRPLVARCHLSLGQLYRRFGQCDEAREHLATAITMLHEMDMIFWLEQAEAEMKGLEKNRNA